VFELQSSKGTKCIPADGQEGSGRQGKAAVDDGATMADGGVIGVRISGVAAWVVGHGDCGGGVQRLRR
jgi:hypothetical protein